MVMGLSHMWYVKKMAEMAKHRGPVKRIVLAGMASAAPPLGSMLAQRKVNVKNFVREFNDRTAKMKKGVPLPTRTLATSDKDFELEIDHPPMEFFIKQAAGITVGAVKGETAGYISLKHVYEIAKIKQEDLPNVMKSMEELCNEVIKAARCCGVLVVPRLDPIEYEQFLQERKKFLAKHRAEIQAALDAKAAKE